MSSAISMNNPSEIPNVALWIDGSDPSTLYLTPGTQPFGLGATNVSASGNSIGCWADKSGNHHHLNQTISGSFEPLYIVGVQNGLSAVLGNGVNQYLFSTLSVLSQDQDVTILYTGSTISDETVGCVFANSNSSNERISCNIDSRDAFRIAGNLRDSIGSNIYYLPSDIGTEFNQITVKVSGGIVSARLNGIPGADETIDGDGITANDYTRIFTDFSGNFSLNGFIGDLIVVDGSLSLAWIKAAEAWLKSKWATP